jgi:hypothetical protein
VDLPALQLSCRYCAYVDSAPQKRPRIVVWWEELGVVVQIAVVAPICIIGMSLIHIWLFVPNISIGRAIGYGIFWGAMLTFALVGATRAERARRVHAQAAAEKARLKIDAAQTSATAETAARADAAAGDHDPPGV